jgi:dolichol-phosphate mannosyltransferase
MKLLSIVAPFYNEQEVIEVFYNRLAKTLDALSTPAEIIMVDDGSTDASFQLTSIIHQRDDRVRLIRLSRNFGQQSAITAGLNEACGDAVIVMDVDLQDPPEMIPTLMDKFNEGYDVVFAVREKRKEGFIKRFCYRAYYRLLARLSPVKLPVDTGDFCIMSRRIVDLLNSLPERNRYIRGLRSWLGWTQIGIPYERERRYKGEPKYTLGKLLRLALDGIVSFARVPFQALFMLGVLIIGVTTLSLFVCLLLPIFGIAIGAIIWILLCLLIFSGIQFVCLGLIGEMLGHISDEVKHRPHYIVREKLGFKDFP